MATTLAQLRRDTAELLGDLLVLLATTSGSTTTFTDVHNLARTQGSMTNWIGVVTAAADSANLGREVRLIGPDQALRTVTLDPPLPAATALGDVLEVYFHRGTGWRPSDYRRAINRAIRSVQGNHLADIQGSAAPFDRGVGTIAIPAEWRGVYGVEVEGSDGVWRDLEPRLWDLRISATGPVITILEEARYRLGTRNVRLLGATEPPELVLDSDATTVDSDYLVNMAAAELLMAGSHRQTDRDTERTVMFFEQRANARLAKARRRPRANWVAVR